MVALAAKLKSPPGQANPSALADRAGRRPSTDSYADEPFWYIGVRRQSCMSP